MALLSEEISAYEKMRNELETDYFGKWVLFHDEELIGTYESFQDAAIVAAKEYGHGPYLIRQVGEGPITLPSSVLL